jgi:alpha-glucosidase
MFGSNNVSIKGSPNGPPIVCDPASFTILPYPTQSNFYKKYINYNGFPIASSDVTADATLRETAKWVCLLFSLVNPAVVESMKKLNGKLAIMATYPKELTVDVPEHSFLTPADYWNERARGLGATVQVPTASCAEENVMCAKNDRYLGQCIMIHEFGGHAMSLLSGNQTFLNSIKSSFEAAIQKGLWKNTYAGTNEQEYFAMGAQSWFDCQKYVPEPDGVHSPINTREKMKAYDPDLAGILKDFFGDTPLRYSCPTDIVTTSVSTTDVATTSTASATGSTTGIITTTNIATQTTTTTQSVPAPTLPPAKDPQNNNSALGWNRYQWAAGMLASALGLLLL